MAAVETHCTLTTLCWLFILHLYHNFNSFKNCSKRFFRCSQWKLTKSPAILERFIRLLLIQDGRHRNTLTTLCWLFTLHLQHNFNSRVFNAMNVPNSVNIIQIIVTSVCYFNLLRVAAVKSSALAAHRCASKISFSALAWRATSTFAIAAD